MSTEPTISQQIDQLVDDDLARDQRIELLTRLDDEPDGWRNCALAFVEAQALRRTLSTIVEEDLESLQLHTNHLATVKPSTSLPWLAMASCLLLAVSIGILIGYHAANEDATDAKIAKDEPITNTRKPHDDDSLSSTNPQNNRPQIQPVAYASIGDGTRRSPRIPVLPGDVSLDALSQHQRPPISNRELKELERRGWKLLQDRRFIFVELNTGDELTIPIDTFRYQFVGNRVY